jgi:cysteine desulfuration protein SufE
MVTALSILSIQEKQAEIVARFTAIEDWESRYREIIALGKQLPPMPEDLHTEANKVKGCQSQVWLSPRVEEGRIFFHADSDASIVRGLVALLVEVYNGHTPDEILAADETFLDRIGLIEHLSQTRSNGLSAMIKQIKYYALAYSAILKRTAT